MEQIQKVYVPPDFYCPISGCLMEDPVSEPSGHTYEKHQIYQWLEKKQTSPITNLPLLKSDLTENSAVKRAIDSIKSKLQEDQLKIDSKLTEIICEKFVNSLKEINLKSFYKDNNLLVNIQMPEVEVRPPVDIVLCIDVSGSMGEEATLKGSSGETIHNGISVLSLTITAAKTVLTTLNEMDNASIVIYTDKATTLASNVSCSEENVQLLFNQLDSLKPQNTTNIWDGLHKSLEILRTTSPIQKLKAVFLLTDGIPNVIPPRGHESMLERYFSKNDFRCMVNCYGFGYNLDSELLNNISNISGGDGYSFIPDSSLLGNIFIHGISNLFTTAFYNSTLHIKLKENVKFSDGSSETTININSLKYGQDKNLQISINTDYANAAVNYENFAEITLILNEHQIKTDINIYPVDEDVNYYQREIYRQKTIDCIYKCIQLQKYNEYDKVYSLINPLIREMKSGMDLLANKFVQDMVTDLEGQIKEALNMTERGKRENWYDKWGKHYLLSLVGAISNELCNNFKDKTVSNFGGELFNNQRDLISDIFDGMDPPRKDIQPDINSMSRCSRGSVHVMSQGPVSTASYNSQVGPCCIHGSKVKLNDGSYKNVENLIKGDKVLTYDENNNISVSTIKCILKTKCNVPINIVSINNLKITPYHPIIYDNKWQFPINITSNSKLYNTLYLYSFETENKQSIMIDEFIFATLGHGIIGDVIQHDYFGTNKVINDIMKFDEYDNGIVLLEQNMIKRDKNTNVVYEISNM